MLIGLVYVLIFASPFFAGFTALIGVVLAYVRIARADPLARSHYAFQIRIFWTGVALLVPIILGAVLGAGVLLFQLAGVVIGQYATTWGGYGLDFAGGSVVHLSVLGIALVIAAGLLLLAFLIWILLAPVYGLARLVSGEPLGKRKA